MRILHVIHSVDPRSGGPSHALRGLVRAQVARGHRVTVVATTAQSAEPWSPTEDFRHRIAVDPDLQHAQVTLLPAWGRRGLWSRYAYTPQATAWLKTRLSARDDRPEVVHIHGVFSHLTAVAAQQARRYGMPYVLRPAGSFVPACFAMGRSRLKRLCLHLFLLRDLREAAAVHATSQVEADGLRQLVPEAKVVIIPHGVEMSNGDQPALAEAFRRRFPQTADKQVVLYLARLHHIKRAEWLVAAAARLLPDFPRLFLVLAGSDAGHLSTVRQAITEWQLGDRCLLPGFLRGEQKEEALAAARVFALPSLSENFGVAVVEAMAHGVPVVVTPGVAASEYVRQARCGVVAQDSIESVTAAIREVLQADRQELGRRGRQYVASHLTWPRIAEQVDELYQAAITNGEKPKR